MLPTPYTVTREPYQAGATDPLGNPVDSWGAAVSVPVHGWAPPSADQLPFEQNRSAIERDLDLYVPPSRCPRRATTGLSGAPCTSSRVMRRISRTARSASTRGCVST